jgi:endonuclease YncB( thermonuclease family)
MRRLLLPILLLCLLVPAATAAAATGPCVIGSSGGPSCTLWEGKVAYVDDGDTLHVRVGGRTEHVRITGIQAMELTRYSTNPRLRAGYCHGVEAADRLDQLVRMAHGRVRLSAEDPTSNSRRRPRRSVAVLLNHRWVDVGRVLIKEGLALWMPNRVETAWNPRYSVLSEQAQAARVGLWNTASCGLGPSEGAPIKLWVNWRSDVSEAGDPDGEWVRIRNLDAVNPLPVGGWWVRDSGLRQYRFPDRAVVPAGGVLTLYVGEGFDDDDEYFWGLTTTVFDNVDRTTESGDGAYLFDPQGDLRAWMTYPCRTTCGDPNQGALELGVKARGTEYVSVRNVGPGPIGLEGYRLTSRGHVYAFNSDAVLQPGETLRVYTTRDTDRDEPFVKGWAQFSPILSNAGGAVRLSTFTDSVLACTTWGDGEC